MSPRNLAMLQCVFGIGALCAMDAVVKALSLTYAVQFVTLMRFATGTAIAAAVWLGAGRPAIHRAMLPPHLLRGALLAAMALAFFWAITRLPLAEALTIALVAPLMVPPLARLFLGEPMHARAVMAGLIGFGGALVAAQGAPSTQQDHLLAIVAVLFTAFAYALSVIVLRARAATDGTVRITLLAALVPAILLSPLASTGTVPPVADWGWFALVGLLGNLGVQLLARAYVHLEAQTSATLEFSGLPWAALMGWLFFNEAVRPQVWLGAAIIMVAILLVTRPAADRQSSP
jgi:S-adenosylmethionine uptake transporter